MQYDNDDNDDEGGGGSLVSLSTLSTPYLDDGRMIMKGSAQ